MTDSEFDRGLEQLTDEIRQHDESIAELHLTIDRFTSYLEEHGVICTVPAASEGKPDDEFVDTHNSNVEAAALNQIEIVNLAVLRMMEQLLSPEEIDEHKMKKHQQANYLIRGLNQPWIDLVDVEFKGKGLNEDDTDILMEEMINLAKAELTAEEGQSNIDEMERFLISYGIDPSFSDAVMLRALAVGFQRLSNVGDEVDDLQIANSRDHARSLLTKHNKTEPVWQALLDNFFPQPD